MEWSLEIRIWRISGVILWRLELLIECLPERHNTINMKWKENAHCCGIIFSEHLTHQLQSFTKSYVNNSLLYESIAINISSPTSSCEHFRWPGVHRPASGVSLFDDAQSCASMLAVTLSKAGVTSRTRAYALGHQYSIMITTKLLERAQMWITVIYRGIAKMEN